MIGRELSRRSQFVAVVAGGFVAMVAVGNEQRLRPHQADDLRDERFVA